MAYPQNSLSGDHKSLVDEEIFALLDKGVIVPCTHQPGEFILPIFTLPKNDGTVRLILNLKELNSFFKEFPFQSGHDTYRLRSGNSKLLDGILGLERCLL